MDRFARNLTVVDTEEAKQQIIRRMVERFNRGYSTEWQALPYKRHEGYEVHRSGSIRCWWRYDGGPKRRRETPLILEPYLPIGKSYLYVTLKDRRNNYVNRAVHLLVAKAFLGKQPAIGYRILHWNGNKQDNRAKNLWWMPKDIHARRKAINYWKKLRRGEIT